MTSSQTTKLNFRRRLDRFLLSRRPAKAAARETLRAISGQLPDSVVFGGMLRDLALVGSAGFSSDIDVVTNASPVELLEAIVKFSPERNRFGGYRFVTNGCSFDIWCLADTWANREGLVSVNSFNDLLATTFFNLDAVAYHLTSQKILVREDYFDALSQRLLDINLERNPNPRGVALRALKLVQHKNVRLSPRLCAYVLANLDVKGVDGSQAPILRSLADHFDAAPHNAFLYAPQTQIGLDQG